MRKVNFWYQWNFIHCNKDSCCEHITGAVNIYLYGCVSLLAPECAVCLCVCVCVSVCVCVCVCVYVWYQIREPYYVSDLSALTTHLGPSGIKLPRLDMCRSTTSLSKIAQLNKQDNRKSSRGGDWRWEGMGGLIKIWKSGWGGRQYRRTSYNRGVRNLLPTMSIKTYKYLNKLIS